jgi:hypothetical protein
MRARARGAALAPLRCSAAARPTHARPLAASPLSLPAVVKDEAHAAEEENQELWTADWDDEAVGESFDERLKRELGRHMKE